MTMRKEISNWEMILVWGKILVGQEYTIREMILVRDFVPPAITKN